MRRLLAWYCLALFLMPLVSSPLAAQSLQHRASASKAPAGSLHRFALRAPSRAGTLSHQSARASLGIPASGPFRGAHVQSNTTVWFYSLGGYPLLLTGYVPAIALYYPAFPIIAPGVDPPAWSPPPQRNFAGLPADPPLEPPARAKPKTSTAEQKARAGKLMALGDANFVKQQYPAAADRYRSAAQLAPDVAEPQFRLAYALIARGQYDKAAKAFRRGLAIRADWNGSPFRLDQLYGDGGIAKVSHIENLAKAVETNPLDAGLLLNLGMLLFFDAQRERAHVFLSRAAQLGGNEDRFLDSFLVQPAPPGAAEAQPADSGKIVF